MLLKNKDIHDADHELASALDAENQRQEEHIELIASENYASPQVMALQGSQLTNKYAEGYPGKRYYGGCEHVDVIEQLAIDRAKKLFGANYANVQPHSGSQANAAAFMALMQPGDTFLGMSLAHGGHLTHGATVNFSGRIYNAVQYGIDANGCIDYDAIATLAHKHQPKLIVTGFSAYSGVVDWALFRSIADRVNARLLVDMAHVAGLVAAGVYPSPVPHAHVVTSTTHKTLAGPRGGIILSGSDDTDLHKKLNFAVFPESQGGPLCHIIAAKAACFREAMTEEFIRYQEQVLINAKTMAATLQQNGFKVISGGTQNHLLLLDFTDRDFTGKEAEAALGKAHITANKNTIPNDPRSPFITSGLRIGTPAITRRGFKEAQAQQVALMIKEVLDNIKDEATIKKVQQEVKTLCSAYPVYHSL